MAGIVAQYIFGMAERGFVNANISTDLDDLTEVVSQFDTYDWRVPFFTFSRNGGYRLAASNGRGIVGNIQASFKDDFYERIHILPSRIDLGTIANTQTRTVSVWNSYTKTTVSLNNIAIQNGAGISIVGAIPPLTFEPLQELYWDVRVTPNGPPQINAQVLFDFTGVADPLPVIIIGSRAVVMPVVPEAPVSEKWMWLTDVHVAVDGTEQRVGLRVVPRRRQSMQLMFASEAELREQYKTLLAAAGRLFVPYFQYSSQLAVDANPGDTSLAFDTGAVDLRDDDYIILVNDAGYFLLQTDAIGQSSATLQAPLSSFFPKGTRVVGTFPSLLPNNITMSRGAVNTGTMTLQSDTTYPRSSHVRPGNRVSLTVFDGYVVLERRPMADNETESEFDTGQEVGDAKVGLVDLNVDWEFTRVEEQVEFRANRVGPAKCGWMTGTDEIDYWREFCDAMRGSLRNFLLSSYRPDQLLAAPAGSGSDSLILFGPSYAENFYPAPAYQHLALTTAAGVHYAKVTGAVKNNDGNTAISFTPALPVATDWADIKTISYLLLLRIADDAVELEHWPLDTVFKFKVRTVKE